MRLISVIGCVALVAIVIVTASAQFPILAAWAVEQQRIIQNEMALAVHDLRSGEPGAWLALLGAAAAYGFVHAVGPGHGKYLIGGVGLGQAVSAPRLLSIALASSLMQALWAILLVYGGLYLFEVSAQRLTTLAETYLASISYLAICAIGLVLVWRGIGSFRRGRLKATQNHTHHEHGHGHDACGCSAHGPRPDEVARLKSFRETVALILSIAVRPCTGAVFLLVIAWQLDIQWAGAAAVITMGAGTGLLTSLVAVSSVFARGLAFASTDRAGVLPMAVPAIQVMAGVAIVWFSAMLFRFGIGPF